MFLFDLFEPRSISSLFRPNARAQTPAEGDIGLERFVSPPSAMPAEISAAWLATSDLSQ
jgi:hypothetical protein